MYHNPKENGKSYQVADLHHISVFMDIRTYNITFLVKVPMFLYRLDQTQVQLQGGPPLPLQLPHGEPAIRPRSYGR